MGKNRKEDGHTPKAALRQSPTRKIMASVVAAGALTAIGQPLVANAAEVDSQGVHPSGEQHNLRAAVNGTDQHPASVRLLAAQNNNAAPTEAQKVDKSKAVEQQKADQQKAEQQKVEEQKANGYVKPADGRLSSGFGNRSGSKHQGLDIANGIGTPIHSVTSGKVVSAGPASGFGQWVRVQHDDGAITIYGHVNTIDVSEGAHVDSGQQIATIGDKGESSGPHLHFGVQEGGTKIDPMPWLNDHGISVK